MIYRSLVFFTKFYSASSSSRFRRKVRFFVIAYMSGLPLTIFRLFGFLFIRKLEPSDIC